MAMSATITTNISTALINQQVQQVLTISNSSGAPVLVTSIVPLAFFTGAPIPYDIAANPGVYGLGIGQNVTVPAGGSLALSAPIVFFAPSTGPYGAGTGTYSLGAVISSNDGSVFSPTAATITVNPIPLPSTEQ